MACICGTWCNTTWTPLFRNFAKGNIITATLMHRSPVCDALRPMWFSFVQALIQVLLIASMQEVSGMLILWAVLDLPDTLLEDSGQFSGYLRSVHYYKISRFLDSPVLHWQWSLRIAEGHFFSGRCGRRRVAKLLIIWVGSGGRYSEAGFSG